MENKVAFATFFLFNEIEFMTQFELFVLKKAQLLEKSELYF